jgi:hypothetical protein
MRDLYRQEGSEFPAVGLPGIEGKGGNSGGESEIEGGVIGALGEDVK